MALDKLTEITKRKTRKEEEKFHARFSEVQLNTILLLVLAGTFLVQGIIKFITKEEFIRAWLIVMLLTLFFLIFSTALIVITSVISSLRLKRLIGFMSFINFIVGILLFLGSLGFLFFII